MTKLISLVLGIALAASTGYLLALLFAYVFGVGQVRRHHVETAAYLFAAAAAAVAFRNAGESGSQLPVPSRGRWSMLTAGFVAASWVLYGNTVSLGLFSDDFVLAERALAGRWMSDGAFVRPVPAAVWAVVLRATGSAVALHALSITLHGLNAALVCLLARRLNLPAAAAVAAGLLFLTFPGTVETVAWPAAVHDLLVTTCAIGFLLLAQRRISSRGMIAATLVVTLGLLTKESAVAIPILATALWVELPDPRRTAGWRVLVAGTAVCLVYTAVRVTSMAIPDAYAVRPSRYVIKELIARPIGTLVLPWSSTVLQSWPALGYLWALGVVVAVGTYAWRMDKVVKPSTLVRCIVAVLVGVLPVYSMLFITADLENGRYLYLPAVFWVIAVVGFATAPAASRIRPAVRVGLGLALAAGTIGVQWHLATWREAARLRDRVLTAAQAAIDTASCVTVSLAGAPDSVRGAYVFRNGLGEAMAARMASTPHSALRADNRSFARGPGDCLFVWTGSAFQIASNGSGPVQATFRRDAGLDRGLK